MRRKLEASDDELSDLERLLEEAGPAAQERYLLGLEEVIRRRMRPVAGEPDLGSATVEERAIAARLALGLDGTGGG
jgi:hypothetical protein